MFIAFSLVVLSACTVIPVDERAEVRDEVDQAAADTIARMVEDDPTVQGALDQSAGYLVGRMSATYDGFTGSRDAFITSISWKY